MYDIWDDDEHLEWVTLGGHFTMFLCHWEVFDTRTGWRSQSTLLLLYCHFKIDVCGEVMMKYMNVGFGYYTKAWKCIGGRTGKGKVLVIEHNLPYDGKFIRVTITYKDFLLCTKTLQSFSSGFFTTVSSLGFEVGV